MNEYPCCILARVSLTLCARGASDCGQSFLMNEPGSYLHNKVENFYDGGRLFIPNSIYLVRYI